MARLRQTIFTGSLLFVLSVFDNIFCASESSCERGGHGTKSECQTAETEGVGHNIYKEDWWKTAASIYEFSAIDINGNSVSLEKYRGHVCVIVNVASQCGYTSQHYAELIQLHKEFAVSHGLRIILFPCNQFGSQEPGSHADIKRFIEGIGGGALDVFSKIEVNGDAAHPLWKYLKHSHVSSELGGEFIPWNFSKFIIDRSGRPVEYYPHDVSPARMTTNLMKYL